MRRHIAFFLFLALGLGLVNCNKDPKPNDSNEDVASTVFFEEGGAQYIVLTQESNQRLLFWVLPNDQVALFLGNLSAAQFIAQNEYKGDLSIPSSFTHDGTTFTVTRISGSHPYSPELTSIKIPNTVKCIDWAAFCGCPNLSKVEFQSPSSLDSIMRDAFLTCRNLEDFEFPNSLKYIGQYAFQESGLKHVSFSNKVAIDECAFEYCLNLESVLLPEGIDTIKTFAFGYCMNLTSVQIPQSAKTIEDFAFICAPLNSIILPDSLESIGCNAFSNANITSIKFPNSLKKLGGFSACPGLTEVTIPSSVKDMDDKAFSYCPNLNKITCLAETPPYSKFDSLFDGTPLTVIYVPAESVDAYKSANGWRNYADIIQAIN